MLRRRPVNRISTMKQLYITNLHLDRWEALREIYKPSADTHYHTIYGDKFYHQRTTITMQDFESGEKMVPIYYRCWYQSWNQTTVHTISLLTHPLSTFESNHSPSLLCIHNLYLHHGYIQHEAVCQLLAGACHSVTDEGDISILKSFSWRL